MDLAEIQAVVDSARSRGMDPLRRLAHRRLPEATPDEVEEAAVAALEIIESVPVFLARATQEARQRNLTIVVQPVLEHAGRYFLRPVDLVPEMTHGLAGLLDDAYLVLRVLQNLDEGPEPFLDWDLDAPMAFLRRMLGMETTRLLDALADGVLREISGEMAEFWEKVAHQA